MHKHFSPEVRGVAMVDDADMEMLSRFTWYGDGGGYATTTRILNGKKWSKKMHIVIMIPGYIDLAERLPSGVEVDHIDHRPLNNQRDNLRVCTETQQMMNKQLRKDNTSGFKGVSRLNGAWNASITFRGKRYHLGMFDSPELAGMGYDRAARMLFGPFGAYNFPLIGETPAKRAG